MKYTLEIEECDEGCPAELALQLPQQTEPQPVYLSVCFSSDRRICTLRADAEPEVHGPVSSDVHNEKEYRVRIPCLTSKRANAFMRDQEFQQILERVISGWTQVWDGSENRGHLTDAAQAALEEVEELAIAWGEPEKSQVAFYPCADWYGPEEAAWVSLARTEGLDALDLEDALLAGTRHLPVILVNVEVFVKRILAMSGVTDD